VKRTLREHRQVIPCMAGVASAQIAPNGDVWSCCIRAESMGNLRAYDYDFGRVWRSARADAMRRSIKAGECYCPLANASYTNMLTHVPTLVKVAAFVARPQQKTSAPTTPAQSQMSIADQPTMPLPLKAVAQAQEPAAEPVA
jgi:hypothetical protein